MPVNGIEQPQIIQIDRDLRLQKFDDHYDFAFDWYQDEETVWLVDGVRKAYSWDTLSNMYRYLDKHGELYFIEALEDGAFRPIGDVCFSREDMPIVIGDPAYRGLGLGKKVLAALIRRGRELGYTQLRVREIYEYNTPSRKCFESMGFRVYEKTGTGSRFVLDLKGE